MSMALRGFGAFAAAAAVFTAQPPETRSVVAESVMKLTRTSRWTLVAAIPIGFRTYHPQGMVKIGDTLFVSSVEVKVATRPLARPSSGYDRDAGEGVGHVFKLDMNGRLIADLRLGEGSVYHPGGLDYD